MNHRTQTYFISAHNRRNFIILTFLAVQLVLPLRGFSHAKLKSRGDFSWNMYSQQYSCRSRYLLLTQDGRGLRVDPAEYSRIPKRISTVFRSDWLPLFNDWLCDELHREGKTGELKARISCRHDFGPRVELLEPYTKVCAITNRGVQPP